MPPDAHADEGRHAPGSSLPPTPGLHHISAMATDPQRNVDVYQHVLGQRLIKTTVNFDDPSMHHLYYGDGRGTLGTALTFFPWPMAARGTRGTGETDAVQYAVTRDSLAWWHARLERFGFRPTASERFGDPVLAFEDPDGTPLELVGRSEPPETEPWDAGPVPREHRLRGFFGVTLALADAGPTAALLARMGYDRVGHEANRTRWHTTHDGETGIGTVVDLLEIGHRLPGRYGAGSIHHIAFRTDDDATQAEILAALRADGLSVSDVRERVYFRSIYAREPGGVLFEFATDGPGFTADESEADLGSGLRLPPWVETRRPEIEAKLPTLERDPMRMPDLGVRRRTPPGVPA